MRFTAQFSGNETKEHNMSKECFKQEVRDVASLVRISISDNLYTDTITFVAYRVQKARSMDHAGEMQVPMG